MSRKIVYQDNLFISMILMLFILNSTPNDGLSLVSAHIIKGYKNTLDHSEWHNYRLQKNLIPSTAFAYHCHANCKYNWLTLQNGFVPKIHSRNTRNSIRKLTFSNDEELYRRMRLTLNSSKLTLNYRNFNKKFIGFYNYVLSIPFPVNEKFNKNWSIFSNNFENLNKFFEELLELLKKTMFLSKKTFLWSTISLLLVMRTCIFPPIVLMIDQSILTTPPRQNISLIRKISTFAFYFLGDTVIDSIKGIILAYTSLVISSEIRRRLIECIFMDDKIKLKYKKFLNSQESMKNLILNGADKVANLFQELLIPLFCRILTSVSLLKQLFSLKLKLTAMSFIFFLAASNTKLITLDYFDLLSQFLKKKLCAHESQIMACPNPSTPTTLPIEIKDIKQNTESEKDEFDSENIAALKNQLMVESIAKDRFILFNRIKLIIKKASITFLQSSILLIDMMNMPKEFVSRYMNYLCQISGNLNMYEFRGLSRDIKVDLRHIFGIMNNND